MKEIPLEEQIQQCLKDGFEVTFANQADGAEVRLRVLGAVNFGASAHGDHRVLSKTMMAAMHTLKKRLQGR